MAPTTTHDDEQAADLLTGAEAAEILRICDKSQTGFAEFIGKSAQFVRGEKILGAQRFVRLQWVRALRSYVSEEDFNLALSVIRSRRDEVKRGRDHGERR